MVFSCALLLLLQAAPAPPAAGQLRTHSERGYALAQAGDLKGAEAELRQAIQIAPGDPKPLAILGTVLAAQGRAEESISYLERALKIDPNDLAARYNLALNQLRLNRTQAARTNLGRILARKPDYQPAVSLLASIQPEGGYDGALAAYRDGRFRESQSVLEQLIASGQREAGIYNLLALCHHRQNRPDEALAAARQAIVLAPADAASRATEAEILLDMGNSQAAYQSALKAIELQPRSVRAFKVKGAASMQIGDVKDALESFKRVIELDPRDPEGLQWLGTAQTKLYLYKEAAATFERGLVRFPRWARMYEAYGKLLLDPGAQPGSAAESRAAALFRKALALEDSLPEAHYELGKLLLGTDKAVQALPHLEAAVKLAPESCRTHLALADAYRALNRPDDRTRALKLYRDCKASEKAQTDPLKEP